MFEKLKSKIAKPKTKEELDEYYDNLELEKGDISAMLIAALITFVPVILIIMAVVYGFLWLVFLH